MSRLTLAVSLLILSAGLLSAHNLVICKKSDPAGPVTGTFTFTVSTFGTYYIPVGECAEIFSTGTGSFTVTEQAAQGTILTGVSATNDGGTGHLVSFDLNAHTATVTVDEGNTTTVTFTNQTTPTPNQGCTPGYYKQPRHASSWVGYSPSQLVSTVFTGVDASLASDTLLAALQGGGGPGLAGAETILLRAAVAGLLNASNSGVSYPLTTSQIIAEVNAALATGDRDTILALASRLDAFNNGPGGCPLS